MNLNYGFFKKMSVSSTQCADDCRRRARNRPSADRSDATERRRCRRRLLHEQFTQMVLLASIVVGLRLFALHDLIILLKIISIRNSAFLYTKKIHQVFQKTQLRALSSQ